MKDCADCGHPLDRNARGDYCNKHYRARLAAKIQARNEQAYELSAQGLDFSQIMEATGLSYAYLRDILRGMGEKRPEKSLDDILVMVTEYLCVPEATILSNNRNKRVARVRHIIFYIATIMGHTSSAIGRKMNRDRTSVMHGHKVIMHEVKRDTHLAGTIQKIMGLLARAQPDIRSRRRRVPDTIPVKYVPSEKADIEDRNRNFIHAIRKSHPERLAA